MKKNILSLMIMLFSFSSCASLFNASNLQSENILMELPIPEPDWEMSQRLTSNVKLTNWTKPGEFLLLTIFNRGKRTPDVFRADSDSIPRSMFGSNFTSTTLKTDSINNYAAIRWQTKAQVNDSLTFHFLILYIKGNDAVYYLQKRWNNHTFSEEKLQIWNDYFDKIKVCDTRNPIHPCE